MWREKIIEAKNAKGIKTKTISEKTLISEKSVGRILSGETKTPWVDDVIAIGAAVGLSPIELFAETDAVVGGEALAALREELDRRNIELDLLKKELSDLSSENTDLRTKNCELAAENDILKLKLELKEEIIATHKYYINEKSSERGKNS